MRSPLPQPWRECSAIRGEGRGGGEGLGRDIRLLVARESGGRSRRSGGEEGGQKGWLSTTTVGDLRRGPPCVVVAVIWN